MPSPRTAVLLVVALVFAASGVRADGPEPGVSEPPPEALLGELPFQGDATNRIYLNLAPEGNKRPLRILLDTGASHTVFSPLAAREAGVRVRRTKSTPYRRKTSLGRDLQIYVDTSSSDTGTRMGWEYGLLGCDFLEHFVLELDFDDRVARFYDPGHFSVPEEATAPDEVVLPMPLNGKRPMLDLPINGEVVRFLVDTGAPDSATLAGPVARKAGLDADLGEIHVEMILGPVPTKVGEGSVAFGAVELDDVPLTVAERGHYNWAGPNDSILGYDLIAEFKVRFDFENRRVWLKHRPDARRTLYGGDWEAFREEGVLFVPRGDGYQAWLVRAGSLAEQRGVREGDRLLEAEQLEGFLTALNEGGELTVARPTSETEWRDVVLAAPAATDATPAVSEGAP